MAFFFGDYEQTIDSKRRLSIVSSLRELVDPKEDGRNFILFLGPDRHLWLYPDQYYRRLVATMRRSPLPSREHKRVALYFAMARLVKPDAQGRVVLPAKSVERAGVAGDVILVGSDDHIEIWPRAEWNARVAGDLPDLGDALYEAARLLDSQSAPSPGA